MSGTGNFLPAALNLAEGQLDSGINASVTSIPLKSGEGAEFPQPYTGSASSTGDGETLNDTGDLGDLAVGDLIWNQTDDSWAYVTDISGAPNSVATTLLKGGTDNTWQSGDVWIVNPFLVELEKEDGSTPPNVTQRETVLIVDRSGDTLTADSSTGRGYNGSLAQSFAADDYVRLNVSDVFPRNLQDILYDFVQRDLDNQAAIESNDDDIADLQNDEPTWLGTITGTNTLTGSATPTRTAYTTGMRFAFVASNTNTGAVTLNVDGLGAKDVVAPDGEALVASNIVVGGIVSVRYDGTQFFMTTSRHTVPGGIGGNDNGLPQSVGLVSRWYLDESSGSRADPVGSNTLTDNNTVTSSAGIAQVNATSDLAAQFTRANSEYLSRADNASLSITGDLSFSVWLYLDTAPSSSQHTIIGKWAASNISYDFNYEDVAGTKMLKFRASSDGTTVVAKSVNVTLSTATWIHVACVYDASAGEVKFFVNGVQSGSTQTGLPTTLFDGTANFNLGALNSSDFWSGRMQDAILWNTELTDAEVLYLYRLYTFAKTGLPTT